MSRVPDVPSNANAISPHATLSGSPLHEPRCRHRVFVQTAPSSFPCKLGCTQPPLHAPLCASLCQWLPCMHPMRAVYADGSICLDILQNQWSPIYDISAILTSIQSLLCDPNPNSPANSEAARLYQENRREYERKVKEIVEQSWATDDKDE